jgi:hypothetical protein
MIIFNCDDFGIVSSSSEINDLFHSLKLSLFFSLEILDISQTSM